MCENKKRVTGIGGIFFKTKNPDETKLWYRKHLGFNTDEYGTCFEWRQADDGKKKGFSQWSPFSESTEYFNPSSKEFMINYRVADLEWLVEKLKEEGVKVLDDIERFDYGKFVHILDHDGNKIELWEPVDEVFDEGVKGRTK
ncbi:MAG: VOC family protein [Cyclobacteriaceae bacterium]|nr:VOC family protein [Cyclobacteriaceae bacterium]